MKTKIRQFKCGCAIAHAEKPSKRRDLVGWLQNRRRRLACEKQPTERQLARIELIDRELNELNPPNNPKLSRTGSLRLSST